MGPDAPPGSAPGGPLLGSGWPRLLAAARRRIERTGGDLAGAITLASPTDEERRLVIGITGKHRPPGVKEMAIPLAALDAALTDTVGMTLIEALTSLSGPVRNRPTKASDERAARTQALADARSCAQGHVGQEWFERWLDEMADDGTVTRLVRRGDAQQLHWAATVLAHLPAEGLAIPVLAERATGNTKALSGTPIAALVLHALALRDKRATTGFGGLPTATMGCSRRHCRRPVLPGAGVGSAAAPGAPGGGLAPRGGRRRASVPADFAAAGRYPINLPDPDVCVCENPAVLRAAGAELGAGSAPLICTEGQPSTACQRLLAGAAGQVHWRGDFDWTGLRTTTAAMIRHRAMPWRMSSVDYLTAVNAPPAETEGLKGAPAPSPLEPELAAHLNSRGRAVMEERLIPLLLKDLALPSVSADAE